MSSTAPGTKTGRRHTAGAFDVRNFIGMLLGLYGIILTLYSFLGGGAEDKTGGVNANLWTGLALLLVGAGFMAWARLRPIVIPDEIPHDDGRPAHH
ncbi:hypothetical protein [Agilicoccus flavus]|uniref:hypothetical protein n=1 Tax=Agilicoccus flavus TaxID=2775968 RepID=UPI001CF618F8|nr:hypothetical protein [Agilicoccus flavus]